MRTELVMIPTDTLPLDGAFYEPDGGAIVGGVLLFHGNTMNFYVGAPRFLPPALTAIGFACLAFNRRGHEYPVDPRQPGGRRRCVSDSRRRDRGQSLRGRLDS